MKSIVKSIVAVTLLGFLLSFGCLAAISFAQDYSWDSIPAQSSFPLIKLSTDKFHDSASEHRTEVEPDTFAWGSTIVSTFQVSRVYAHGGADIGFATSTDRGKTWTSGYLPDLTVNYKGGSLASASDPAVVYDAKHSLWLIAALAIPPNPDYGKAVSISRSADGIHWGKTTADQALGIGGQPLVQPKVRLQLLRNPRLARRRLRSSPLPSKCS